jgi:hypothetical protein
MSGDETRTGPGTTNHLAKGVEALEAPHEAVPSHDAMWGRRALGLGCVV